MKYSENAEAYFYLCCGQNRIRIRSARGGYMKYSANQRRISSLVVGRTGSEYGLPVAVIYNAAFKCTSAELPRGAIETGQLSRLRFRAGPIVPRGNGIAPFGSTSTTLYSLCPLGHVGYMNAPVNPK